ncbi:GDSL-like Lipase/Acylhydrolase [Saccharicrinis carchari]|uniref:GDSL-like Lipase/Acylhydrolase n=1 Tax=Saccharicrinis carchari TaxID=1168039 RepID=A0A521BX38_SACCC|nr:hypothetical protein [Saccharicrinis carchari]SMO51726.1 GDSL-like Lipase/Acylhydrolase [Saccharicrinis carchari]
MLKPPKIFLYYLIVLMMFGVLSYFIPADGVKLGSSEYKLRWLSLSKIFTHEEMPLPVPASDTAMLTINELDDSGANILQPFDSITTDTLTTISQLIVDTIVRDSVAPELRLIYPQAFKQLLQAFYRKIETADDSGKVIRILHMGDSQIEGDRISRYLRQSFQTNFKGSGPGLVPLYDPLKQFPSVWIRNDGLWSEHVVYKYPRMIKDNQYGIMGKVSLIDSVGESSVHVTRSSMAQPGASHYYKSRLFLKNIVHPFTIKAYWGNELISSDSLKTDENITEINWTFQSAPKKFSLFFESEISPLFLGMSLDSLTGIAVDNIAMRGQSSPRLDKTDTLLYKQMAGHMNIGMVILQYGTNMVPTVTENYTFYRLTFYRQLQILKQTMPGVPVVVVGVGDVGKLTDGRAEAYTHIYKIKEAQKAAAVKAGFAFFDLFEAMGGQGSMIEWVNGNPRLAMSDYTHFNKPGGKKVADWLYSAIMNEYERGGGAQP